MVKDEIYCVKGGRLAKYKKWGDGAEEWDNLWLESNIKNQLSKRNTDLGEINVIQKYLPTGSKVLEAGCGTGWVVQALALKGYDIEGIDYARKSIELIHQTAPELKVRYGNILSIDAPDNTYFGYISLGVMEHNPDGPLAGLQEAFRVLQPGGLGFFTVPYLNTIRRKILNRNIQNGSNDTSLSFYQYCFSQSDFSHFLKQAGFEIVNVIPIGLYYGLEDGVSLFSYFAKKNFLHWRLHRFVISACKSASFYWRWNFGHMLLFVARKAHR